MTDPVDLALLPPQHRTLVRAIGVAATVRLLEARGGWRIRVSHDPAANVALRPYLNDAQIAALCAAWGGQRVTLPMPDKIITQWRDSQILGDPRTNAEIAAEHGITVRRVQQIRNGEWGSREAEDQPDLFQGAG